MMHDTDRLRERPDGIYEGRSFNVAIGILQGALLVPFTFRLLQPFEINLP